MRFCHHLVFLLLVILLGGCFPTEYNNPVFQLASTAEVIPANETKLTIPFRWDVQVKTSRPQVWRVFRCMMSIDASSRILESDEYDWYWDYREGWSHGDALLYVTIPENSSGESRDISVYISIDNVYRSKIGKDEWDEEDLPYQWGEWQEIWRGIQSGRE